MDGAKALNLICKLEACLVPTNDYTRRMTFAWKAASVNGN
jgi:hypothetical protein